FFSSRRRHTRFSRDWSSDVCSSDLLVCAWSVGRSGRTCVSNTDLLSGDVEPQAASSATSDSGEQAPQSNGAGTTPKRRPGGLSRSEERRGGKEGRGRGRPEQYEKSR